MKIHAVAALALITLGTGCDMAPTPTVAAGDGADFAAITAAPTALAFAALGATQVDAATFQTDIVGRTMTDVGGGWTWIISADGTNASYATDGSWGGVDGNWALQGDSYCIDAPQAKCRDVWMLGDIMRLANADGSLDGWSVRVP